jgi:hypothetical protein
MRRWSGAAVAIIAGALLAGCAPVIMPAAPDGGPPVPGEAPDFGPGLALDVVNASDREVSVGFEFDSVNAGGGGEGTVPACERTVMTFGDVAGTYEVTVAGTTVVDAQVPPGMPARGYLFVRVQVDADGSASADGPPRWVAAEPASVTAPLANCG